MDELAIEASGKEHRYNQLSDEALMLLYQKDDELAFHSLYRRYSAKIYGYMRKKLRASDFAADLCQTVFIKLHNSRELYHATLPFAPWLFTIARNTLIDWQRNQSSYQTHHAFGVDISNRSEPEPVHEPEIPRLARLPSDQRAAVEMRYIESLDFEDIAQRLGTSSSNARQLVSRGLRKIRSLFPVKERKS